MNGIMHDRDGNKSSKRYNGTALNVCGATVMMSVAGVALMAKDKIPNGDLAYDAGIALLVAGSTLLGVTLIERFGKKKE